MEKKRIFSLLLAAACVVSLLSGCGGKTGPGTADDSSTGNAGSTKHEPITMTAMVPFRNPSHLADLVHEQYPEINIEFIPYSGYNATAYTIMQMESDNMTDIYFGSMYNPAVTDMSERLLDLSAYPFTDNFTNQRLHEVTDNGSIYMLPLCYSVLGITYNKTLPEESDDEFGFMPYLSADGQENTYVANVNKFIGLNKHLADEGNEQKLEDALHVMEIICTVDGMRALNVNTSADVLEPLKDFVIPEDSIYKPIEEALNEGYVAPYVYTGWEDVVVPVGEKMYAFMRGECDIDEVIRTLDDSQYLLSDNSDRIYTTVTEDLSVADCAKLVGIQFAKASGADVALVSTNKWYQTDQDIAMNTRGVQCPLYAMPITDQELTAMLPTGWTGTIQTVTLTGARIKELAETGYDKFEDETRLFPYSLVMPDGFTLADDTTYTVAICGASKAVQEEGNIQDTGIVGLTMMEDYLSGFDTFSPADITWD